MKPVHTVTPVTETNRPSIGRRRFIAAAAGMAAPLFLPRGLWGQGNSPGARLTLGVIGMGQMGNVLLRALVGRDDMEVVAVCDVDTTRREAARRRVDEARSERTGQTSRACSAFNDFRELLARDNIDAVVIATPDHWHAFMGIAAVQAGKDVYCEKPLTHNVHEAGQLVQAVRRSGRVFQTGSQQRSGREFRVAAELVRNGVLGRIARCTSTSATRRRTIAARPNPLNRVSTGSSGVVPDRSCRTARSFRRGAFIPTIRRGERRGSSAAGR